MASGRHKGRQEGEGGCPIVVNHQPRVDQLRIYRITSCIDAVFQTLQSQVFEQDIRRRTSRFINRAPLPLCLPSRLPDVVHATLLPGFSLHFLHNTSNQKLEVGTAWERGYPCFKKHVSLPQSQEKRIKFQISISL